jgi:hypothetical protein
MLKREVILEILPNQERFSSSSPAIHSQHLCRWLVHKPLKLSLLSFSCDNQILHINKNYSAAKTQKYTQTAE